MLSAAIPFLIGYFKFAFVLQESEVSVGDAQVRTIQIHGLISSVPEK